MLPVLPQPPDDPLTWLLNTRVGWRIATQDDVEIAPSDGQLALKPLLGSGRSLNEASGSLGGLTLPGNVALAPDGTLFLLDRGTLTLKRFDVCAYRFVVEPCFGGLGSGRRQLSQPHGIAVCNGNLFVCDSGNQRLSIFALQGFVWRAAWRPPARAMLDQPWQPYAVSCDSRGRVFVSDPANNCVHRFSPSGYWEAALSAFPGVTTLAIDCADRLYVVTTDQPDSVQVVDGDGKVLETPLRPEELAGRFPRLPLTIDAQGNLHLADLCVNLKPAAGTQPPKRQQEQGVFDLQGNALTPAALKAIKPNPIQYPTQGRYISKSLDSQLYRCQWHRIILHAQVPGGTRIVVSTYTAEADQSDEIIANLPEDVWETRQSILQSGEWEGLIRNGGGRYLWLRLQLRSSGSATPQIADAQIEYPRISLLRYLPPVFAEDPGGTCFTERFLSIFDTTLRSIEGQLDTLASYFDPLSAPADARHGRDFLTWLASWIGVSFDRQWSEQKQRQFLKRAAQLYHIRGTRQGLYRQLLFFLGIEPACICCPHDQPQASCRPAPPNCVPPPPPSCAWQPPPLILEHYQLRRWLFVGSGRLGDQALLWGSRIVNRSQLYVSAQIGRSQLLSTQDPYRDPFHVYAHKFSVFVPASYGRSEQQRKSLANLINGEKPAHTLVQIEYVEPRFRIGVQSMIGLDSVIGRYPEEGVTLSSSKLGSASVLSPAPDQQNGPTLRIGKQARIGSTTRLD
jgi:phage tail-like protein